jgi:hypothetical protein
MQLLILLADGNDEINNWLGQNPLVLGLMFLVLGLVIGGWGVYELMTGVAYSKRGKAMTGSTAQMLAIVRIVAGTICILFALYKMVAG